MQCIFGNPSLVKNPIKNQEKNKEKPRKTNEQIDGKSMKIYEKSSKIELGGVLGPLGASWGAFLASLGVLGASWERLESVLERLGGVPVASQSAKGSPHGPQDGPKIVQKSIPNCIDF